MINSENLTDVPNRPIAPEELLSVLGLQEVQKRAWTLVSLSEPHPCPTGRSQIYMAKWSVINREIEKVF